MWERHDADLAAAEAGDTRKVWRSECCEICGDYIREGDEVAIGGYGDEFYHLDCLDGMPVRQMLVELGFEVKEV